MKRFLLLGATAALVLSGCATSGTGVHGPKDFVNCEIHRTYTARGGKDSVCDGWIMFCGRSDDPEVSRMKEAILELDRSFCAGADRYSAWSSAYTEANGRGLHAYSDSAARVSIQASGAAGMEILKAKDGAFVPDAKRARFEQRIQAWKDFYPEIRNYEARVAKVLDSRGITVRTVRKIHSSSTPGNPEFSTFVY